MSFFLFISFHKPEVKIEELLSKKFYFEDMRNTPIAKTAVREVGDIPFMVTRYQTSESLVDQGDRTCYCSGEFAEWLSSVCPNVKSVSVFYFAARGYIYTEKVIVKSKCKMTITEFLDIFPNIEENVLYLIRREYREYF